MSDLIIKSEALEPLFSTTEQPSAHRIRKKDVEGAVIEQGRRPSAITVVNNLRREVDQWREAFYPAASDTSRTLMTYWFERSHRMKKDDGEEYEFRYYFCQREAIETLIYLKEVRQINVLSQVIDNFGGPNSEIDALGITEEEDAISRYCFKLATGTGKTKLMSLAIVWSYFHTLFESESEMARHFVVIAPNLTVFERLKEDFRPPEGGPDIFDTDPLIPPEWRGDWNMNVVLQSEASGAATGGVIYLTNIQQLYDYKKRRKTKEAETYDWAGPPVSQQKALDTGKALRKRITSHERVMVLNDEAHHVWDPDNAWNEAITYLNDTIRKRTGGGLSVQLDFTATPKDNHGNLFKHVVCDTPLGEAVDGGLIKTPIIGSIGNLGEVASDDAAVKYHPHLKLGYERWRKSREEWDTSGKKALLFIMCENTKAADQITYRLNHDKAFEELNGKTINLHVNLKGKVKKIGKGKDKREVFVENDNEIKPEDLKKLRELSRGLDNNSSPYNCIVSVLMLREGWDVKNVTTIVPLRPYSSKANILPEQTLGRGLRRITPAGQANEIVTVVEHPAFTKLYRDELTQEGLPIEVVDVDKVPATTVSIFPDEANKDIDTLDIKVPKLTAAHKIVPKLEGLAIEDVKKAFEALQLKPLPLAEKREEDIDYEGRHLITNEVVENMKIHLPLLMNPMGALSFYIMELENVCKVRGLHRVIAPLLQTFFEEVLFVKRCGLHEPSLLPRLSDPDVRECVRAIFVPLIRKRTTATEERRLTPEPMSIAKWKAYQATNSERHPVLQAGNTLFNLVPCNQGLEVAFTEFSHRAPDVTAFAKNAGPQCLRIDYFSEGRRLAFYTPDFFVRDKEGNCYLVETKGRQDRDVPIKAQAAIAWCESASSEFIKWEYVYVPQGVFQTFNKDKFTDLVRTCAPARQRLITPRDEQDTLPLFAFAENAKEQEEEKAPEAAGLVDAKLLEVLPPRYRKAAEQAIELFRFFENKEGMNYAPAFTAVLGSMDEAAKGLIIRKLSNDIPFAVHDQKDWFTPYFGAMDRRLEKHYSGMAHNLKRTLIFKNGLSPIGLLRNCLDYALNDNTGLGGVFLAIDKHFENNAYHPLLETVTAINDFRNQYVAHQEKDLNDKSLAEENLKIWIHGLANFVKAR